MRTTLWCVCSLLSVSVFVALSGCNSKKGSDKEHQEVSVRKDVEPAKTVDAAIDNEDAIDYKASHRKMLELLRAADKQSKEDHPFLGLKPLRQAEQALKDAPADLGAWDRSVLHGTYGQQLLRSGKTIDAIRETLKSVELAESLGDKIEPQVLQQVYYITGVAYLRDAENVNCVNCLNGERCLFPIEGEGIHEDKASSRSAIEFFHKALKLDPHDVKARWLLNICYMTLGEYPSNVPPEYLLPPELFRGAESPVGKFVNIAKDLGLNIKGCAGSVIVDDFDGDLDLDVVFSSWETDASLRFFRNEGQGKFVDATEHANFAGINGGLNLVHADYDNDGDLDILVLRGAWLENRGRHPKSLLRNDGTGRFWDVTLAVGLMDDFYPSQTADWADFDHDGDLDLYIGNEGFPCQLMKNNGRDGFQDIAKEAGVLNGGPTKGSAWGDYDNDGWPDLYVSNLGAPNKLYHNNHDGTFTDVAEQLGVAGPIFSFPVWFWDFDNDGRLDLYVSSYKPGSNFVARDYMGLRDDEEPDAFYFGTADGKFEDRREQLGFKRVTQPMGVNIGDIDNDGFLDCYIGTGYVDYEGLIPNVMFHNVEGKSLEDITFSAKVGHLQKGHGVSLADFDEDGDLDIFAVMGGWFSGDAFARVVFENKGTDNRWLFIRLVGVESDRYGLGCRVRAQYTDSAGSKHVLYRTMDAGGSFGDNPFRIHLGLRDANQVDELEVTWPTTGKTQQFKNVGAGRFIEITEGKAEIRELHYGRK